MVTCVMVLWEPFFLKPNPWTHISPQKLLQPYPAADAEKAVLETRLAMRKSADEKRRAKQEAAVARRQQIETDHRKIYGLYFFSVILH